MKSQKFLQFNGKTIFFQAYDGQFWIAIKPICEALNLEYTRQFKNLKEDEILNQLLAEQPMVGADNRIRKMVSLPEKYIYGWLFSINSSSDTSSLASINICPLLSNMNDTHPLVPKLPPFLSK